MKLNNKTIIIPMSDLRDTNSISELCHETKTPIFITKNGHQDMVIMDMDTYDRHYNNPINWRNFVIKEINKEYNGCLLELLYTIEKYTDDDTLWIPFTEKQKEGLFSKSNIFVGAFNAENDRLAPFELAGAGGLFMGEKDVAEDKKIANIKKGRCAKLDLVMVSFKYRGYKLMQDMVEFLIEKAKNKKVNILLTEIHPQNLAAKKTLEKLGFKKVKEIVKNKKYKRAIMVRNLDK